jgi:hypothetical protein
MKKTSKTQKDGLRREYRFDYSKSKPNRFASQVKPGSVAIVLEPDVASVFETSEAVNQLLRSVIAALPKTSSKPKRSS